MYEAYFGLTERPFSIAPDPQYLFMSSRHKEAMAHLSYGLSQGGCFIVLSGEVGTGKTTLCRNLLSQLPGNVDVALILNANISETELLQTICDELKIDYQHSDSQKQLLDQINRYLLNTFAENRHTVLIIDEAQLLSRNVLEQIRLLTNLETTKSKLLQIILIGQPELNDLLLRDDLRQLAQRVTARYHLGALQSNEIEEYVNTRLSVAGCKKPLFSKQALSKLHSLTEGIPRKINVLADHALLASYSKGQLLVDAKTVQTAVKDVFISQTKKRKHGKQSKYSESRKLKWWFPLLLLVLLNGLALWWFAQKINLMQPKQAANNASQLIDLQQGDGVAADVAAPEPLIDQFVKPKSSVDDADNGVEIKPVVVDLAATAPMNVEAVDEAASVPVESEPLITPAIVENEVKVAGTAKWQVEIQKDETAIEQNFRQILEASSDLTSRITAYRSLAKVWQQALPNKIIKPICDEVNNIGLQCLVFSSWQQLLNYNRPAITVLEHRSQLHRVVVASIDGDVAKVILADNTYYVPTTELQALWNNSGVLFWRASLEKMPTGLYQIGDSGDEIAALRQNLNETLKVLNMPLLGSANKRLFDEDMFTKVSALQDRFQIIEDGKVGKQTYVLMNEIIAKTQPPVLFKRLP